MMFRLEVSHFPNLVTMGTNSFNQTFFFFLNMAFVSKSCTARLRADATLPFCRKNWAPCGGGDRLTLHVFSKKRNACIIRLNHGRLRIFSYFSHRKFHMVQPKSSYSRNAGWGRGQILSKSSVEIRVHGHMIRNLGLSYSFWTQYFKGLAVLVYLPFSGHDDAVFSW